MADVMTGIVSRLGAYTDLTDLVATRIHRLKAPHDESLPYLVLHKITTNTWPAMGADIDPASARIQVDVYDDDGAGCDAAALEVKNALTRWSGTAGGVTFQEVFFEDENDGYENDTNLFRKIVEFTAFYEE